MIMIREAIVSVLFLGVISGCATNPVATTSKFDSKSAEKAKPYLSQHYAVDLSDSESSAVCAVPKSSEDWKAYVLAAGACVQKQDWSLVEKLGAQMAESHIDSPWGAYFLGLAAAQRGEMTRAEWMMDLSEKKAGAPMGIVQYERARWIEKEQGAAAAAVPMKEAVQRDPNLLPALLWLAQVHHRDRMNVEAEKYYQSVLSLKSDSWSALHGMADLAIENQKGSEAVSYLNRAIQLKPEIAETRARLAVVYETLTKEPAKAVQTLRDLRVAIEKGRAKGKLSFDITSKIRAIEQTMKSEPMKQAREREPANKGG